MKEVIAIISRKGGTGKTTTAQSIGAALQKKRAKVLLVDLDAQRNLTASMGAKFTGYNITHLLEGTAKAADVIQHTDNGDIITGSPFLAGADLALTGDNEIKNAIRPLLSLYDYIIFDTPANYGKLTRNALAASTSAVITAQAATYSLQGLNEVVDIVDQMKPLSPALELRGVIITIYSGRSNKVKALLEDLRKAAKKAGTKVIEPPIRATDKVAEAQDAQKNLIDYAPKSTAAECYAKIADKIYKW